MILWGSASSSATHMVTICIFMQKRAINVARVPWGVITSSEPFGPVDLAVSQEPIEDIIPIYM
jgi:hypothetical protein